MKNRLRRLIASYLERQVQKLIAQNQLKVVAVTGSVGKTSTKLAIAHVLSAEYQVQVHQGNYNSEIGLPLSIFGLETPANLFNPWSWIKIAGLIRQCRHHFKYDLLVLEMGVDHPGEMDIYLRYLRPDISVVTAVQLVHAERFKTLEAIAAEKWKLAEASRVAVVNVDDETLASLIEKLPHSRAHGYGLTAGDFRFEVAGFNAGAGYDGTLILGAQSVKAVVNVIGTQSLYPVTAAAAVGSLLGVKPDVIVQRLATWRPVKGRMNPLHGKNGSLIIDDSYNSSPRAAEAALAALLELPGRRHIAVLGSMNELGDHEQAGHEAVGRTAAKVDLLITIGPVAAQYLAPAAIKAGMDQSNCHNFESPYDAGRFLATELQTGDVVLVKGSQNGVFAEEAAKLLLANSADSGQLVRQSESWLKRKQRQFEVE